MGNAFSTRWWGHVKRKTVEQVSKFSMTQLRGSYGMKVSGLPEADGIINFKGWLIKYAIDHIGDRLTMTLSYSYFVDQIRYDRNPVIEISETACNLGGKRYWFHCPFCGRRIAILYQDGGAFACRQCHELTYNSVQPPKRDFLQRQSDMNKILEREMARLEKYEAREAKAAAKNKRPR